MEKVQISIIPPALRIRADADATGGEQANQAGKARFSGITSA
ncbi:hypothetical protein [Achromobacter deleyi]|nr:hypothetical protein [Achromobacter deleyi]